MDRINKESNVNDMLRYDHVGSDNLHSFQSKVLPKQGPEKPLLILFQK